jgi:predicted PhzF superfamily epimerase YddE/YHI9
MVPVDACTDCVCSGNPAAVLILAQPLADGLMQAIAAGNRMADQPRCSCGGWPEG